MSKTKYIAINSNPSFQISISNEQMRQMEHFKYLSVWVTKKEVELEKKNWNVWDKEPQDQTELNGTEKLLDN